MLVLDSGGLSRLAARIKTSVSLIRALTAQELWPPLVPTMVLVESLHGDPGRDTNIHRSLKACIIESTVSLAVTIGPAHLVAHSHQPALDLFGTETETIGIDVAGHVPVCRRGITTDVTEQHRRCQLLFASLIAPAAHHNAVDIVHAFKDRGPGGSDAIGNCCPE